MVVTVLGMKKTREVVEDAGRRVSTSVVAVAVIALVAALAAGIALGVALCRS